jgi:hypothetical protein
MKKMFFIPLIFILACVSQKNKYVDKSTYYYLADKSEWIEIRNDSTFSYHTGGHLPIIICSGKAHFQNDSIYFYSAQCTFCHCDSLEKASFNRDTLFFKSLKFLKLK